MYNVLFEVDVCFVVLETVSYIQETIDNFFFLSLSHLEDLDRFFGDNCHVRIHLSSDTVELD